MYLCSSHPAEGTSTIVPSKHSGIKRESKINGKNIKENNNLGTITGFAHIGATVADYLGVEYKADAPSLLGKILK